MENIIEKNKLIAEFMGWVIGDSMYDLFKEVEGEILTLDFEDLKYHSSWD